MSKVVIADFFHSEWKVNGDNSISFELIGHNTKGKRVHVEVLKAPSYMVCFLASSASQSIAKLRDNIERELKIIREDAT